MQQLPSRAILTLQLKVPRFDTADILVVGDAMVDRYWRGRTERVSPEAPIPVVDIAEIEDRPGGAANVALNVATLGASARLVAAVGDDELGATLASKLHAAGIETNLIQSGARTTAKVRIVSHNQQLIRADFEDNPDIPGATVISHLESAIDSVDSVLLSDYDKGVLTDAEQIVGYARDRGKAVLIDPKFKDFVSYRGATVIKPNRKELEHAIGTWDGEADLNKRGQQLIANLQVEALLVTRASEGMTLIRPGLDPVHFPARTREVYDVSGAGDTVIATLASALGSGETLADATGLANVAAGLVVAHFGITSVSGPELRNEIARDQASERGVMSREQVVQAVAEAQADGRRVVFTNGCFDILHAGHVTYLEEARTAGDVLVVGINDDASVTRLKGEGRPINTVEHRMTLLAGLAAVDHVVSFHEDTPENLLTLLKPDVLVKGGDYAVDQVVGAEIVREYGGDVKVLALVDDCSTSALVEKIRTL